MASNIMDNQLLSENIEQQLLELEMLEAMYPGKDELQIDEETTIEDVRNWLLAAKNNTNLDVRPPRISFKLCLTFSEPKGNVKKGVDINILYPHEYPSSEPPEIYVKSRDCSLNRAQQFHINEELSIYMKANVILSEVCLVSIISWLNETCPKFIKLSKEDQLSNKSTKSKKINRDNSSNSSFVRLWIYSHHIYSKIKRKDILDLSTEYQLSGFCMPGKPGIICIEGSENNCMDAWGIIRSWNWKKINVKNQEKEDLQSGRGDESIDKFRRFSGFDEIGFVKNSDTRDYHMDMGEFSKYLDQHLCLYMFKILFGFEKQNV